MSKTLTTYIVCLSILFNLNYSQACTVVVSDPGDAMVFAKNFDWTDGKGYLAYSPVGVERKSSLEQPKGVNCNEYSSEINLENTQCVWKSKFSSMSLHLSKADNGTFMQPTGGMNSQGLMVEVLWVLQVDFPQPDQKKKQNLEALEFVRYLLDTKRSIAEVKEVLSKTNISNFPNTSEKKTIHYIACDKLDCIVIDFTKDKQIDIIEFSTSLSQQLENWKAFAEDKKDENQAARDRILSYIKNGSDNENILPPKALSNYLFKQGLHTIAKVNEISEVLSPSTRFAYAIEFLRENKNQFDTNKAFEFLTSVSFSPKKKKYSLTMDDGEAITPIIPSNQNSDKPIQQTQWSFVYQPYQGKITIKDRMNNEYINDLSSMNKTYLQNSNSQEKPESIILFNLVP